MRDTEFGLFPEKSTTMMRKRNPYVSRDVVSLSAKLAQACAYYQFDLHEPNKTGYKLFEREKDIKLLLWQFKKLLGDVNK